MRYGYKTPIEEYAEAHPGCTLREYLDEENLKRQKSNEEELERYRLEEEYTKSLEGKYFKLDFNGSCIIYFRLNSIKDTKVVAYEIYSDRSKPFSMTVDVDRHINMLWFSNPYRAYDGGSKKAVEIEESEFLRITKLFEEFSECFKQIRDPNN